MKESQQPREAIAMQPRLISDPQLGWQWKPGPAVCPQKYLETEPLMMQLSFTHPTRFISQLPHAKYLVSISNKMLSERRLASALKNLIIIKDDENLKVLFGYKGKSDPIHLSWGHMTCMDYEVIDRRTNICWLPPTCQPLCQVLAFKAESFLLPSGSFPFMAPWNH